MRASSPYIYAAVALVLVASMVAALVWLFADPDPRLAHGRGCADLATAGESTGVDSSYTLLPGAEEDVEFSWMFGSSPHQESTRLVWQEPSADPTVGDAPPSQRLTPDGQPPGVELGDTFEMRLTNLENQSETRSIPPDQVGFLAVAVEDGVEVQLCVDADGVRPGRYTGALKFSDPDIRAAPLAVEMTVTHGDVRVPLTFFILGALAALLVALVKAWASQKVPLWSLLVALVIALFTVILDLGPLEPSAGNPTWGATNQDFITLLAATFFGVLGASALVEVFESARDRGSARRREADEEERTT